MAYIFIAHVCLAIYILRDRDKRVDKNISCPPDWSGRDREEEEEGEEEGRGRGEVMEGREENWSRKKEVR